MGRKGRGQSKEEPVSSSSLHACSDPNSPLTSTEGTRTVFPPLVWRTDLHLTHWTLLILLSPGDWGPTCLHPWVPERPQPVFRAQGKSETLWVFTVSGTSQR